MKAWVSDVKRIDENHLRAKVTWDNGDNDGTKLIFSVKIWAERTKGHTEQKLQDLAVQQAKLLAETFLETSKAAHQL
jgi:hypothetical protein